MEEKIIELIEKNLNDNLLEFNNCDNISEVNLFDDLGYDSLAFIKLIVDIEDTFKIEIPEELLLMENFSTISQVVKTIITVAKNGRD